MIRNDTFDTRNRDCCDATLAASHYRLTLWQCWSCSRQAPLHVIWTNIFSFPQFSPSAKSFWFLLISFDHNLQKSTALPLLTFWDQTSDLVGLWARNAAMAKYHRVVLVILLLQARLWCKRKLRDLETGYSQPCQPRVKADTKTCFSSFFPIWHLFWCSLTKESNWIQYLYYLP